MTKDSSTYSPFVWLYLRTEDTNFSKPSRVQVTGESLISFSEEVGFHETAVEGSPSGSFSVARAKLVLFDPTFTFWETLLLVNARRVDYEYGWINSEGNVVATSGRIRASLMSLTPKFSYQGSEVEVVMAGGMTANVATSSSAYLLATKSFSRTFVPADIYDKTKSGEFYNSRFPKITFATPSQRKAYEDSVVKYRNQLSPGLGIGSGRVGPPPANPQLPDFVALSEEDAQKKYGERYKLPTDAVPYTSVSDLVRKIAGMVNMKADVDDTDPATAQFRASCTLENLLRTHLVQAATKDGRSGYNCWIYGDTIYFKSIPKAVKDSLHRKYIYGGNNLPQSEQAPFSTNTIEGTLLGFDITMQPNLLVNSPINNTVVVGFNSTDKTPTGANLVSGVSSNPNWELAEVKKTAFWNNWDLAQLIAREVRDKFYASNDYLRKELLPAEDLNTDWLVWDDALKVAQEIVNDYNLPAIVPGHGNPDDNQAARNVLTRRIQSEVYSGLMSIRKKQQEQLSQVGADASWKDGDAIDAINKATATGADPQSEEDKTSAGRLYVMPYRDARISQIAAHIQSSGSMKRVFRARAMVLGDPSIGIMKKVSVNIPLPDGRTHYASGNYIILNVNHKIDNSGFTTELTLGTDSLRPTSDPTLQNSTVKNSTYSENEQANERLRSKYSINVEPDLLP